MPDKELIEPILPIEVSTLEWATLRSEPESRDFSISTTSPVSFEPRAGDNDDLVKHLQDSLAELRLVIVGGLSYDAINILGTAFPQFLEYECFEQQLSSSADIPQRCQGFYTPKPYIHLQWYRPYVIRIGSSISNKPAMFAGPMKRKLVSLKTQPLQNRESAMWRGYAGLLEEQLSMCFIEQSDGQKVTPTSKPTECNVFGISC